MYKYFVIFLVIMYSCNDGPADPPAPVQTDTVSKTIDQVKAEKPQFPGFHPKPYILGQDSVYIRIVSNSSNLQKAWMVYYDAVDRKWSTLTWIGSGNRNTIIGDSIFTRKNGLVNGTSTEDAPVFYTAYSTDSGKTWQPHHTYETFYRCQYDGVRRSFNTTVLVSNDYLNAEHRPSISIIIQNRKQSLFNSSTIERQVSFDFLCPVTRQLAPYRPT